MKTGFIGAHPMIGHIVSAGRNGHEFTGVYPEDAAAGGSAMKVFPTAESLITVSDVLFISRSARHVFEMAGMAVKEGKHLFLESPFCCGQNQVDHLYHLARESGSIIKLNRRLIHQPLYTSVKDDLNPGQVMIRIEAPLRDYSREMLQDWVFEAVSLLRDAIPSGLRRCKAHIVQPLNPGDQPPACQVKLDYDNGSTALIWINHLTGKASYEVEFLQDTGKYDLSFSHGLGKVYDALKDKNHTLKERLSPEDDLTVLDFNDLVDYISAPRIPLTMNEEHEAIHQMAYQVLEQIDSKIHLFA